MYLQIQPDVLLERKKNSHLIFSSEQKEPKVYATLLQLFDIHQKKRRVKKKRLYKI